MNQFSLNYEYDLSEIDKEINNLFSSKFFKYLRLTISREPMELILSGEKHEDYREDKPKLTQLMFTKDGVPKHFDYIEFRNGYEADSPRIIVEYKGYYKTSFVEKEYSNGFIASFRNVVVLKLGKVVHTKYL